MLPDKILRLKTIKKEMAGLSRLFTMLAEGRVLPEGVGLSVYGPENVADSKRLIEAFQSGIAKNATQRFQDTLTLIRTLNTTSFIVVLATSQLLPDEGNDVASPTSQIYIETMKDLIKRRDYFELYAQHIISSLVAGEITSRKVAMSELQQAIRHTDDDLTRDPENIVISQAGLANQFALIDAYSALAESETHYLRLSLGFIQAASGYADLKNELAAVRETRDALQETLIQGVTFHSLAQDHSNSVQAFLKSPAYRKTLN